MMFSIRIFTVQIKPLQSTKKGLFPSQPVIGIAIWSILQIDILVGCPFPVFFMIQNPLDLVSVTMDCRFFVSFLCHEREEILIVFFEICYIHVYTSWKIYGKIIIHEKLNPNLFIWKVLRIKYFLKSLDFIMVWIMIKIQKFRFSFKCNGYRESRCRSGI